MKSVFTLICICLLSACGSSPTPERQDRLANLEDLAPFWVDLKLSANEALSIEEREYALASWVYSVAADRTYLEPETLCFPLGEDWQNIEIGKSTMSRFMTNGFFGQAWLRDNSKQKELIIAYRGTDSADDFWYGNFSIFETPFSKSQFKSALEFRDLVKAAVNPNEYDYVIFVGHSLGGGLAQYAQDFTPNSKAYVFNASPNRGRLYSLFETHQSERFVTRVYEKGEVLEWPRWLLFDYDNSDNSNPGGEGMQTKWFQFYQDNLIENHNMKDFSAALTKLAAVAGDSDAKAVIGHLKNRRLNIDSFEHQNCTTTDQAFQH